MIDIIKELRRKIHTLQVRQAKSRNSKLIILIKLLQNIKNQIMFKKRREKFRERERESIQTLNKEEYQIYRIKDYYFR